MKCQMDHNGRQHILPLVFAAVCGLSLVTGCGCGKESPSDKSGGDSSGAGPGSDAIGFHNDLIAFSTTAREPLRKIMDAVKASDEWIEYNTGGTKPRWELILIGSNPYDKLAKSGLAAPDSFAKDDKTLFNTRIQAVKNSCSELSTIVATLAAYYKAEDYKDDQYKKFLDLKPRIEALTEAIATAIVEMGERSETIASAAEREALKKNPVGMFILNLRDITDKCEAQMEFLTDERLLLQGSGTESKTDAQKAEVVAKVKDLLDPAEALAKEIADMAAKFSKADRTVLKDRDRLAKDYDAFFTVLEDQQGTVRKNLRFANEHGYIGNEGSMKLLGGTMRDIVNAHNTFIESLNKGN